MSVAWVLAATFGGVLIALGGPKVRAGNQGRHRHEFPHHSLVVRGSDHGRIVLGHVGQKCVAAEKTGSLAVLGPTQSGKTTGLAIPALLGWQGPAIASSVKADLLVATEGARRTSGVVMVVDPARTSGRATHRYSPLFGATSERAARAAAHLVVTAAGGVEEHGEARFWQSLAEKLLAPLLYAARALDGSMATCLGWLETADLDTPARIVQEGGAGELARALEATKWRDPRQLGSVIATAETYLAAYIEEDMTLPAFDIAALFDEDATLYLVAPVREQQRFASVLATCTAEVIDHATARARREGGRLNSPLLVVLDEAAQLGPARDLDVLAATGAGQGIMLVSVFQDLAQLRTRFGTRAETVLNNHRTKVLFGGVGDPATLELFSMLGGEQLATLETKSRSGRDRSMAAAEQWRPRFSPGDLRGIPFGSAFVVAGRHDAGVVRTSTQGGGGEVRLTTLLRWRPTTRVTLDGRRTPGRNLRRFAKRTPSTSTTPGPMS